MQFRRESHAFPQEQGRLAKPAIPICVAVRPCEGPCAESGRWGPNFLGMNGMKGILALTAPILSTFAAVAILIVPGSQWVHAIFV